MTTMAGVLLLLVNSDFTICNAAANQTEPAAYFANGQYYVFWTDLRALPVYNLYGARISATGTVIDPNGKQIFGDSVGYAQAAYDGANFLVVWREGC